MQPIDPTHPPTMRLDTAPGDGIRFTGEGGYRNQQEIARAILTVETIYTVRKIEVGNWISSVSLAEKPGHFNTVMFQNVDTLREG